MISTNAVGNTPTLSPILPLSQSSPSLSRRTTSWPATRPRSVAGFSGEKSKSARASGVNPGSPGCCDCGGDITLTGAAPGLGGSSEIVDEYYVDLFHWYIFVSCNKIYTSLPWKSCIVCVWGYLYFNMDKQAIGILYFQSQYKFVEPYCNHVTTG